MNDKQENRFVIWLKNTDKKKVAIISSVAAVAVIAVIVLVVAVCVINKDKDVTASSKKVAYGNDENATKKDDTKNDNTENDSTKPDNMGQSSTEDSTEENTKEGEKETTIQNIASDENDIKENQADENLGSGASVDISKMEKTAKSIGIDVARYQGKIDWKAVAADGIDFAMIRAGYRSTVSGEINEDPYAAYNITNALANNINVGIYFFSSAVTENEAVEEADCPVRCT